MPSLYTLKESLVSSSLLSDLVSLIRLPHSRAEYKSSPAALSAGFPYSSSFSHAHFRNSSAPKRSFARVSGSSPFFRASRFAPFATFAPAHASGGMSRRSPFFGRSLNCGNSSVPSGSAMHSHNSYTMASRISIKCSMIELPRVSVVNGSFPYCPQISSSALNPCSPFSRRSLASI